MTINAAYIIRASNWFNAQQFYWQIRNELYKGPSGDWVVEKSNNGNNITAINCDDANKITTQDFAAVRDLLTERGEFPARGQYEPTQNLPPMLVIDLI